VSFFRIPSPRGGAERAKKGRTGTRRPRYRQKRVRDTKKENGTRHPRNRRKRVRARKTRKRDATPPVPSKTSQGAQNVKKGPDALGTAKNMFGSGKHENEKGQGYRRKRVLASKTRKWDPMPPIPLKTCSGAQNVKTGPDALGTIENESGSAKHEKGTLRHRYRRKRF
jgi:hypothetical protein